MKTPEDNTIVEINGISNESLCSIGNMAIIFDILRNKLYSDIKTSIAREISCNARDANRESGNKNTAIKIQLPNILDNNYIISDCGIGISPSRMNDIYRNYGNSTKRDSNEYVGFFGLGSKTPWAYSSQFSIKTTSKENNISTTRTYLLYIDKSKIGTISLVKEELLNLPTGTDIIIPIEEKDFEEFATATLNATKFWDIKPILSGRSPLPEYTYNFGALLAEGSNWKVYANNKRTWPYTDPESVCLIDGIAYNIDVSHIAQEDHWIFRNHVHFYFGIGDLTLSASRESLQYDEKTVKLLQSRVDEFKKEFSEQFNAILESKPTYKEAVQFYENMLANFSHLIKSRNREWHGYKIGGFRISIPHELNIKSKDYHKDGDHLRSRSNQYIYLNNHHELYVNDIDVDHVFRKKIFQILQDKNIHTVQMFNLPKDKTLQDLIDDWKNLPDYSSNEYTNYSFILELYPPKKLSSIIDIVLPKVKQLPKVKVQPSTKIHGWVFKPSSSNYWDKNNFFTAEEFESDLSEYYVEVNFKHNRVKSEGFNINTTALSNFYKMLDDIKIYAVQEKEIKKLSKNWKPLYSYIKDKYEEKIKLVKDFEQAASLYKLYNEYSYKADYSVFLNGSEGLDKLYKYIHKINSKSNPIRDMIIKNLISKSFTDISYLLEAGLFLGQMVDINKYKIELDNIYSEAKDRYPLLACLNHFNVPHKDIITYINLIDNDIEQQLQNKTGT